LPFVVSLQKFINFAMPLFVEIPGIACGLRLIEENDKLEPADTSGTAEGGPKKWKEGTAALLSMTTGKGKRGSGRELRLLAVGMKMLMRELNLKFWRLTGPYRARYAPGRSGGTARKKEKGMEWRN
jgi:hypothetical protein